MAEKINWKDYLDPLITIGDLTDGRFQEKPTDLVISHDGIDFCLCDPEFEPGDFFTDGTRSSFYCPAVYMEVWIGGAFCWAPLTRTGAKLLVDMVCGKILGIFRRGRAAA